MRTSAGWLVAGSSLALLVGCELPGRDNPIDPVNAPVAHLKVIDRGFPGADGCPAVGDASFPEIVSTSRGRCLALDARDSLSPKDHELGITFVVLDSATKAVLASPPEDGSTEVALLEDFLRILPFGVPLVAEVSVEDASLGATVRASSVFSLENSTPLLVVDRPRTLPLGGFGWALGADFVVPFGIAGSMDADGDPLYLEVTVDGAAPVLVGPLDAPFTAPVATPSIPSDERGPFVVAMRIFDGPAGSPRSEGRPERAVVRVREPNPWMHLGGEDGAISRIDGTRRIWTNPVIPVAFFTGGPSGLGGITRRDDDPVLVVRGPVNTLTVNSWPDGQLSAPFTISVGSDFGSAVVVGENGEIWRVGGTNPSFQRMQIANGGVAVSGVASLNDFFTAGAFDAVVTADGNVWAASLDEEAYVYAAVLDTGGTPFVSATRHSLPGRHVVRLSRRPSTDEIWMLDVDLFDGDPMLRKLTTLGGTAETWSIAAESATGLAWAGADSFWLTHDQLGLVRIDARLLDAGVSTLEAAVLDQFPIFGLDGVVADNDTGTAYARSGILDQSWRADTNGRLDVTGGAQTFFGVDPDGAALLRIPQTSNVGRATTMVGGARDRTMAFAARPQGASDPTNGGAWLYRTSGDIVRVDEEGTILAQRRTLSLPGGAELLPPLAAFRPSPDGSHAWAIEFISDFNGGRVFHIDLRAEPMPATEVLADADAIGPAVVGTFPVLLGRPRYPILEPSAPDGSTAWIVHWYNGTPNAATVVVLSTDGTLTQLPLGIGDVPERGPGGVVVRAAVSQKTNSLCLATVDGNLSPSAELRVRRLHLDGDVDVFVTTELPLLAPAQLVAVATSSTDTEDFCWVTWMNENGAFEVRAYADDGPVPERTLTGPSNLIKPLALMPFRGETLWLTTQGDFLTFESDAFLTRYDFLPLGGIQETPFGVLRETAPFDGPVFLSPAAPIQRYQPF